MVRHRYELILISMAMISGWVTLSGSSVFQATETITPTETVNPSFTPTMPWCEYTPTKRYQDVIPVFEFGAISTIDPLATETPTPAPTETTVPSETPIGNWYGFGNPINETYEIVADYDTTTTKYTSNAYCGSDNKLKGMVIRSVNISSNNYTYWREYIDNNGISQWRNENGTAQEYLYIGKQNDGNINSLVQGKYPNIDFYGSEIEPSISMQFLFGTQSGNKTNYIIEPVCFKYSYQASTPTLTPTPEMTVTPNCRPYTDEYSNYEPFAKFDYNYVGNTCITLFNGIELSLVDLPSVLLDAMDFLDSTGIFDISAVPELEVSGLEVCLDQYEPIITIMDMDLVNPLSIMITLVVIGGLINEFRS